MSIRTNVLACSLFLLLSGFSAADARADDRPVLARDPRIINGGSAATAKAVVDTIRLMGPRDSGAPYVGDFELGWNGWTSFDETQPPVNHWQVSDYNQPLAGDLAAWCGDLSFPSCDGTLDPAGGYGNNWHDLLSRRIAVHDPGAAATVRVTAALMNDTEPGYDYTYLSVRVADSPAFTDLGTVIDDGAGMLVVAHPRPLTNGCVNSPAGAIGALRIWATVSMATPQSARPWRMAAATA